MLNRVQACFQSISGIPASRQLRMLATRTANKASGKAPRSKVKLYVPATRGQDANAKLYKRAPQDPYHLALTAKSVADNSGLEKAIQMVKDASLDSQSTIVWNTLMKYAIITRRFTLSFELFIDMKRRGFEANIRTYFTLLSGWAKAEHREITPRQLERAKTVFGEYIDYMTAVKAKDPASPELGNKPVNEYLAILNRAKLYQTMFDVFYGMEKSGPLAPDQFTFTVMINAIGSRKALHAGGETPPEGGESDVHAQNASDVRFLWKQLVKASQRCGFPIDSYAVTGTIFALAKGTPIDQTLAFSIIHDYLGLSQPGEPTVNATVPLSKQLLTSILALCNSTQQPRLTLHYAQRVMDSPQREVLQRTHLNEVLRAHSFLSTPDNPTEARQALETLEWMVRQEVIEGTSRAVLRPDLESYNLALLACWRSTAWSTACRVFEMMSGYSVLDFEKPARKYGTRSVSSPRSKSRIILPDAESMSTLARTALTQRAPDAIRQCLRIIAHLGPDHFFIPLDAVSAEKGPNNNDIPEKPTMSRSALKHSAFHQIKLSQAIGDLIDALPRNPPSTTRIPEEWAHIAIKVQEVVKNIRTLMSTQAEDATIIVPSRGEVATVQDRRGVL